MAELSIQEKEMAELDDKSYNRDGTMTVNTNTDPKDQATPGSTFTGVDGKTWTVVAKSPDNTSGFQSYVFRNGNDLVVAVTGSQKDKLYQDWRGADLQIGLDHLPNQILDAKSFLDSIKSNPRFADCNITLSGHSLGGGIVEALGSMEENSSITTYSFNGIGTKHLLNDIATNNSNIKISTNNSNINVYAVQDDLTSHICEHNSSTIKIINNGCLPYQQKRCHSLTNFYKNNYNYKTVNNIKTIEKNPTINIYDSKTNSFYKSRARMYGNCKSGYCTATLLNNGKVLILGTNKDKQAIYDPSRDKFINTKRIDIDRSWHTATLLKNGDVLITGGAYTNGFGMLISTSNKAYLYKY